MNTDSMFFISWNLNYFVGCLPYLALFLEDTLLQVILMLLVDLEDIVFANILNDEAASCVRAVGKH